MTRDKLNAAVSTTRTETKDALQTVYDTLNQGQQKKILNDRKVKELFDLYGVAYT